MTTPTTILRDEHTLILRALDLLEAAAARLESGSAPAEDWWRQLVAWLRGFADRTHHAKEERALFPAMGKAGVPDGPGGPIAVMLEEHEEGRALVKAIEAGGGAARAGSACQFVDLLRAHIDKENEVLFPMADAVLDPGAQRELGRAFEAAAAELGREGTLAYASAALDGLAAALGPTPAR